MLAPRLAVAVLLAALAWARGASAQVAPGALHGVLGANSFDLAMQFQGLSNGSDASAGHLAITRALARKAIADAASNSFAFVRVAVTGYNPHDGVDLSDPTQNALLWWRAAPDQYWARMDAMFDELDAHGLRLVPSFVWNPFQFPVLAGDTLADFIGNPASASRRLLGQYVAQFIARYRRRPTILFYEMGNELNLQADLDLRARCLRQFTPAGCVAHANFSSGQLNAFAADIAALIRAADPSRPVTSGYALPRPAAAHLAARPEFIPKGPDWTQDSEAQFRAHIASMHAPFDLVSIHLYPGDVRWGNAAGTEGLTLDAVAEAAAAAGKRVFVGEFTDSGASPFIATLLRHLAANRVAYAAVWVWEFYQGSTWQPSVGDGPTLEPGVTDALNATLAQAALPPSWADPGAPRVVITAPPPCARLSGTVELRAVASASQPITRMAFLVDDVVVGLATQRPFHVPYVVTGAGLHRIGATAAASGIRVTVSQPAVFASPLTACEVP